MSLNRSEQLVFDYLESHPEEKRFWQDKVITTARGQDPHVAAARLAEALWSYFEERSAVAEPFLGRARHEGVRRISMRNLAELLLRLWAPPPKKRPTAPGSETDFVKR